MEIEKAIKETGINRYYSLKDLYGYENDTFVFPKEEAIKIINFLREDFFLSPDYLYGYLMEMIVK